MSFPAEQKTAQMEKYEIIYEKTKPIVLEIREAQVAMNKNNLTSLSNFLFVHFL